MKCFLAKDGLYFKALERKMILGCKTRNEVQSKLFYEAEPSALINISYSSSFFAF